MDGKEDVVALPAESAVPNATQPIENVIDDIEDIEEVHTTHSVEKNDETSITQGNGSSNDKVIDLSKAPLVLNEEKIVSNGHNEHALEKMVDFAVLSDKALGPVVLNTGLTTPEISEIEISTPPSTNEMVLEYSTHSRKKWMSDENSSKAPNGFRKLLFFGHKSRNTA